MSQSKHVSMGKVSHPAVFLPVPVPVPVPVPAPAPALTPAPYPAYPAPAPASWLPPLSYPTPRRSSVWQQKLWIIGPHLLRDPKTTCKTIKKQTF